ncbi:hypothetical protein F4804DRAFT_34187 [Jackrogersella minutella]|nr:hypothetical protein F4804DRAFT_34187 [Jackrogersella minutella]
MDDFAQLSRENFEVFQRYSYDASLGPESKHRAVAIYAVPASPATYVEEDLKVDHLPGFFRARPSGGGNSHRDGASLKLIVIESRLESWSSFTSSLCVTKDIFLNLVDAMDMNPSALWLIRSEYDGFHHFPSLATAPANKEDEEEKNEGEYADTYYIGTSSFALIWAFDRRRLHTRALLIHRQQHSFSNSAPAAWFVNILRRHQEFVRSPVLLAYATALSVCCTFDGEISYRAHVVRLTERETGYSTHSASIEERLGIESLTVSIKEVGEVLNHIANKERHFRFMDGVLDFIVETAVLEEEGGSTTRLVEAIPLLRSRMRASREYLTYLKERAERLSTVLFALLTHEDSATNTELADSSRRIAEAAKRDSSSMKTVAIMTMAFLPATFFAALFSVPSLDWHSDDAVVQSNFWVYWAFTLPATAIVFALWFILDTRFVGDRASIIVTEGRSCDDERPRSSRSKFE